MSVRLEWQVDDAETPLPPSPTQPDSPPGGLGRRWGFFVFVALPLIAVLVFLGLKIKQQQKDLRSELRAIVELELAAFLNGDRDLFLAQQARDDWKWMSVQEKAFDQHREQVEWGAWRAPQLVPEYTGAVPVVDIEGDKGWAQVQIAQGARARRELWFYRWTQADGWRHTWLDPDWLGYERQHTTPHLCFTYLRRDRAIVTALADEMETWYAVLAPFFGAESADVPLMTVEFTFRNPRLPGELGITWARDRSYTLLAPSPHQGLLSAAGGPSPELRRQMADYFVEALIAQQTDLRPQEDLPLEINALRQELRDWAVSRLKEASSDTHEWFTSQVPLVDALVAREGVQILPRLATALRGSETLNQALVAVGLDPPDLTTYLIFLLVAHTRAFDGLDEQDYRAWLDPEAERVWLARRAQELSWQRQSANTDMVPLSLQITLLEFDDEIAWVETESARYGVNTWHQVHFFRQVGGRWLLTLPDPSYFGERREARTDNLVFYYFERDARWFEGVVPDELQTVFSRAAADLDIVTENQVFTIEVELQPDLFYSWGTVTKQQIPGTFWVTSPSIEGWSTDQVDDTVFRVGYELVEALVGSKLKIPPILRARNPYFAVHRAIVQWELRRLFPGRPGLELPFVDLDLLAALSLADFWPEPRSAGEFVWELEWVGYHTLIEYLAEAYGPEVIPALLDNLSPTSDLDEWLRLSTGDGVQEIEPMWQAWMLATYGER